MFSSLGASVERFKHCHIYWRRESFLKNVRTCWVLLGARIFCCPSFFLCFCLQLHSFWNTSAILVKVASENPGKLLVTTWPTFALYSWIPGAAVTVTVFLPKRIFKVVVVDKAEVLFLINVSIYYQYPACWKTLPAGFIIVVEKYGCQFLRENTRKLLLHCCHDIFMAGES